MEKNSAEGCDVVDRRTFVKSAGAASTVGLAGCAESEETTTDEDMDNVFRAAFIYDGPVDDLGWTRGHDRGRQKLDEHDWVETSYADEVPYGEFDQFARDFIDQGYDAIYGTTIGFMDPMLQLAQEFPEIKFENAIGVQTQEPNMSNYHGRYYQARYLEGITAGLLSETDQIGIVAGFPVALVIREINALAIGAREVNPDITVDVRYLNAWYDPPAARDGVQSMIDDGAGFITQLTDSPAGLETADENDIWGAGIYSDMSEFGGENYVRSIIANWEEYYIPRTEEIRDGDAEVHSYWEGLESGIIGFDEWGPNVPDDVKTQAEDAEEELRAGERDIWAGTKFENESEDFIFSEMSSYVEGVEGTVPE